MSKTYDEIARQFGKELATRQSDNGMTAAALASSFYALAQTLAPNHGQVRVNTLAKISRDAFDAMQSHQGRPTFKEIHANGV